ncbi:MAG: HAD family phosphatase [Ruminococcus sp.]|jgi:HAD superfamily hydrolase (TIGR01509 family)|nr:HAD family phosphatase [Ruminococcus sp.]
MKNIKLKGAIFDMDGVLIDTEKLYLRFWKEAAAEFGYDMRDEHVFAVRSMARKYSIPKLKSMLGEDFPTEEVRSRRTELMNDFISKSGIETKKGLFRLLNHLRDSGIKIAVATATQRERTLSYLSRIGALEFFDAVICGDMVTAGKPAPDIYLTAAAELGLPPEECAAFEDSPNGLMAAHSAGCYTVMVPDLTQPDDEVSPYIDNVIEDLGEAVSLFGEVQ